jgi:hypothetical protein
MREAAARGLAAQRNSQGQAAATVLPSADQLSSSSFGQNSRGIPANAFNAGGDAQDPAAQGSNGPSVPVPALDLTPVAKEKSPTSESSPAPATPAAPATTTASGAPIGGPAHADGVPFDGSTGPIGAATAGATDPTISITNQSNTRRYYKIEGSVDADPQHVNNNVFYLDPGQKATINPGVNFSGAITDQGSSVNSTNAGTRHEFTFMTASGQSTYDSDLERGGETNSTLGPTDTTMLAADGRPSLVGNQYAYHTHGAVQGQAETDEERADDLKTMTINTSKFSINSYT